MTTAAGSWLVGERMGLNQERGMIVERMVHGGVLELVVLCVFNHTLCCCIFWWADKHNSTA